MPQLRASDLAKEYGFTTRYWIKAASRGEIPGARQPSGRKGQWVFEMRAFRNYANERGLVRRELPKEPKRRKPLRASTKTDVVYAVYSAGHVKFGVSSNVTRRSHSFKTASPAPVHLLARMPGSNSKEAEIHRRFASARHKGEWFRLTPEVRAFILECQTDGDGVIELASAEREFRRWYSEISFLDEEGT